jgi:hypothetical protein
VRLGDGDEAAGVLARGADPEVLVAGF